MNVKKLSLAKVLLSLVGFIILWTIVTDAWGYSDFLPNSNEGSWGKTIYALISRFIWTIPAIILLHLYANDLPAKWKELFSNRPHMKSFMITVAIIMIYCLVGMIVSHKSIWINPEINFLQEFMKFAMVGFVEELVYRGWGLNALSVFVSKRKANIISTLFFVLLHLPAYFIKFYLYGTISITTIITQCAYVLVLGLLFGYLYNKGKSLWSPMIVHFLADFLSVMVIG